MNPNMIKKEKMILAGVSGLGNETAEIWKRFMKLFREVPLTDKVSDDSYEVRVYDSATGKESVFVGCEVNGNCNGYEIFQIPSSEYASFDVYVEEGYESENNAMEEWLFRMEKDMSGICWKESYIVLNIMMQGLTMAMANPLWKSGCL